MTSMDDDHQKLHIAMFPWLAFGHIIPFLELAKLIAQKGHRISFISTPRNIQRLNKIPKHLTPLISLVSLPLPYEPNLPENAESTMDVPPNKVQFIKKSHDGLEESLVCFLESSNPDWIIHDFAPYWLPPITAKLGIPRVYFSVFHSWSLCYFGPVAPEVKALYQDQMPTEPEHFTVPPKWIPFPTKVTFRLFEAKKLISDSFHGNVSSVTDLERYVEATRNCDVFAVRSCMELEAHWLKTLAGLCSVPVLPVSLIPPSIQIHEEENDDHLETSSYEDGSIVEWLDKQEKGSVIFVAFGSEAQPSQQTFTEIAFGLDLCGLPFFWVIRNGNGLGELPESFKDRTRGRGFVCSSWAPQLKILAHPAVGGLYTHCGSSSIIEALHFGHPLVMMPVFGDQGLIARFYEERKVGVEIRRNEEDGLFTRKDVADSIRLVMVDEEGKIYREKAEEMRLLLQDKKLHQEYVDKFVLYLENHSHRSKPLKRVDRSVIK